MAVIPELVTKACSAAESRLLAVRLLSSTTRSVAPTEAGERLLHRIGPRSETIESELVGQSTPAFGVLFEALRHRA
ncbi:hypothetical protein [Bradyrhizobium sp. SZCCHNS3052]|uniref:hypothetical protein n=1 Tax=Bradyrhizobium sp. SZCCHNS3052 TaxID=3057321 RepID=UPI003966CB9E